MAAQAAGFAPGAGAQIERGYRWDKASAPLAIPDKLWGETAYAYDQNGQVSEARFGDALIEKFSYDAARNMAGASSSGPQAISGLGEDIGRFVAWKSSPGGLVQTARGPRGERLTLTHDKCGRVVERRIERDGFRVKIGAMNGTPSTASSAASRLTGRPGAMAMIRSGGGCGRSRSSPRRRRGATPQDPPA